MTLTVNLLLKESKDLYRHLSNRLKPGSQTPYRFSEVGFVEEVLFHITQYVPVNPSYKWFCNLLKKGPGQDDPLFSWLAEEATLDQLKWFLGQEAAGEAGFGDLVAMTLVGMPTRPKLEMSRNFWDEVGNGREELMHDGLLRGLIDYLGCRLRIEDTVDEALMLSNFMSCIALNRRYAFYSVGALGVIEMTAPGRVTKVDECLTRLGVPKEYRIYFKLHGTLDVKHSEEWNREVIQPLWAEHGYEMAIGAYTRLWLGLQCFNIYRKKLYV